MDYLLAIGEIPDQLVDPILQEMRRRGMDPILVRVNTELRTDVDFQNAAFNSIPMGLPEREYGRYVDCWITQKQGEIIWEAFRASGIRDVKAVIRPSADSTLEYDWLMERLPVTVTQHFVYIGDNGGSWLEGDFGHFEPITLQ